MGGTEETGVHSEKIICIILCSSYSSETMQLFDPLCIPTCTKNGRAERDFAFSSTASDRRPPLTSIDSLQTKANRPASLVP